MGTAAVPDDHVPPQKGAPVRWARYAIVAGLEHLCGAIDWLPWYNHRWYRHGTRGCAMGLANISAKLDEKWHTGWWKDRTPGTGKEDDDLTDGSAQR